MKDKLRKSSYGMLGKKHSEETKAKMSKSHKGKIHLPQMGFQAGHERFEGSFGKGDKHTKETIKKMSGKNNHSWKGGLSRNKHGNSKSRKWRMEIFTRDNFTCQICEGVGGTLQAHHIQSWVKYPKLRYSINNGITLCKECHNLIHKKSL